MATEDNSRYMPRQAYPPDARLYEEIVGDSTSNIAKAFLSLIGPIPQNAYIHDNGCGGGQVMQEIMAMGPPTGICAEATDIDPTQIARCREAALAGGWPVKVSQMPAEMLSFPDATFTHSFSNLLLFATRNTGVDAAQQIFRTLKPGGLAVTTWFHSIPHQEVVKQVHQELRGPEVPLPHGMPEVWYRAEFLREVMEKGGFRPENIRITTIDTVCTIPDLERWITILWSYIGAPATGWTQRDEDNWDSAVQTMCERIKESTFWTPDGNGGTIKLGVNVAIAQK